MTSTPPKPPNYYSSEEVLARKVFVTGLKSSTTEEMLYAFFSQFGSVEEAHLIRDVRHFPGRSKGCGFVTFHESEVAKRVLEEPQKIIDNQFVHVKIATAKSSASSHVANQFGDMQQIQPQSVLRKQIYVGGIHPESTESDVVKSFAEFGKVVRSYFPLSFDTVKHRGFGFLTFDTEEAFIKAIEKKHHVVNGREIEIRLAHNRKPSPVRVPNPNAGVISSFRFPLPLGQPYPMMPTPINYYRPFMPVNRLYYGYPLRYSPYHGPRLLDISTANKLEPSLELQYPFSGIQAILSGRTAMTDIDAHSDVRPTYVGPNPNLPNPFAQTMPYPCNSQCASAINYGTYASMGVIAQQSFYGSCAPSSLNMQYQTSGLQEYQAPGRNEQ